MNEINIQNKKASFEFFFIDKYVAGIQLVGTEIKSIREGKINLTDGFCFFKKGELLVKNINIALYAKGVHFNHEPNRERKLLLKKQELKKLEGKVKEKGLTIIPIRLFVNEKGLAKLEIALAKGKKIYDKRESIRKKESDRELKRAGKWE